MDRNIIMDNRKNNGGSRPGAGAKKKDPQEVKVTVSVQIKRKHLELGKPKVQALVDKINSK
jgi:hypothetical protein